MAQLVTDEMRQGRSAVEAVAATLPRLRGAFALGFLFAGEEDLLIGARHGAPLAIGYGEGEMYLGSDALALAPLHGRGLLPRGRRLGDPAPAAAPRSATAPATRRSSGRGRRSCTGSFIADKGNHRHFMAKEIHEQPEVVGRTLAHYVNFAAGKVELPFELPFDFKDAAKRLSISACGTAYLAGLVAKYWFERLARLPVEIDVASEFRYREAPLEPGSARALRLAIRRDRRYPRLAALRQGATGSTSLSVVNVTTSTMARESTVVAQTLAGIGDRRRLDEGLHLPARGPALPRDRGGRARGTLSSADGEGSRRRAHRRARPDERGAASGRRRSRHLARDLSKAQGRALSRPRHLLSRWPWKAR